MDLSLVTLTRTEKLELARRLAAMPRIPDSLVPPLRRSTAEWGARKAAALLGASRIPRAIFVKSRGPAVSGACVPGALEFFLANDLTLQNTVYLAGHEVAHALGIENEDRAEAIGRAVKSAWLAYIGTQRASILQTGRRTLTFLAPHSMKSGSEQVDPVDRPGLRERMAKWYGLTTEQCLLENELEALIVPAASANPGFVPLPATAPTPFWR